MRENSILPSNDNFPTVVCSHICIKY